MIELHQPLKTPSEMHSLDQFEIDIILEKGGLPTVFAIPGFKFYGCAECHEADLLAQQTAKKTFKILTDLRRKITSIKEIPLKRFVIQPYSDMLLKENQFAHATFDAIRISPRTLIIDTNVYSNATLIHELLHLTQPFIGHPNELEAYALNALADPRFLLLNYRYFENTIQVFGLPNFQTILKNFFARDPKSEWKIPVETQWYMLPADELALENTSKAIHALRPLIDEAFRLNRDQPLLVSYWSDRTGIPSFVLDLAAVYLMPLPLIVVSSEMRDKAFKVFDEQFSKTDNTALGYVIDRKKETLMILRYQHFLHDKGQGLAIYFHYLKQRFMKENGELSLEPDHEEDFRRYLKNKAGAIRKMVEYSGMSRVEKEAGLRLTEWVEANLAQMTKDRNSRVPH